LGGREHRGVQENDVVVVLLKLFRLLLVYEDLNYCRCRELVLPTELSGLKVLVYEALRS